MKARYDTEELMRFVTTRGIELTKEYEHVDRETLIQGKCKTVNCPYWFCKSFRMLKSYDGLCVRCMNQFRKESIQRKKHTTNYKRLLICCIKQGIILSESYRDKPIHVCSIIQGYCPTQGCEHVFKKELRSLIRWGGHCTECMSKKRQDAIREASMDQFGVPHHFQDASIKDKIRDTVWYKYGVENVFQLEETKEKSRQTCLRKYGSFHHYHDEAVRKKYNQTIMDRYGVDAILKDKYAKLKRKATMRAKAKRMTI